MRDQSNAHEAVVWAKQRLDELDTMISEAEKSADNLKESARKEAESARTRAEAALKELRDRRDAYRAQAKEVVANARTWTDSQIADTRKSLDENWTAFQTARDEYLEAAKADLAARQAVLEAELEARQKEWQRLIDELRAEADKLAGKQREALEARIDALPVPLFISH